MDICFTVFSGPVSKLMNVSCVVLSVNVSKYIVC